MFLYFPFSASVQLVNYGEESIQESFRYYSAMLICNLLYTGNMRLSLAGFAAD